MNAEQVQELIEKGIPGAIVIVKGEDDHFEATVVSDEFDGKGLLEQQRAVYATLGDRIGKEIHAVSMRTYTSAQWRQQQKLRLSSE